jgi:transcriptional regulator with XRE-family HTH domain
MVGLTIDDLERQLGASVRALRLARGVSQVALADQANVSLGALKHLESGAGATISTLVKVLRALEADDWLSTLAPPPALFNPLDLLAAKTAAQSRRPRSRVRRAQVAT